MAGDGQPVELASRATLVETAQPPPRNMEELAERAALRGGQLALEGLTGLASKPGANRQALAAMLISLATAALVGGFIIAHEMGNSKFERAIEGLIDVLESQNPESSRELRDVERKMHR